jgi:dTMP kinase
MRNKGIFICIEGPDKSGKSTQARLLVKTLLKNGFGVIYTTEPSQSKIGEFIKGYVLGREERLPTIVEALLFAADRAEHTQKVIKPMLKKGKIVVSDRYLFSSLAYQGASNLDLKWINNINNTALTPDLTIYLNVPLEVIIKRCKKAKSVMENLETQRKVLRIYNKLVLEGKMISLNGNRSKEKVNKGILKLLTTKLKINI